MTNLSISPAKLEIQLKPGTNFVQSYIIKNNGDKQVVLNTSIDSWIPKNSQGDVTYLNSLPNIEFSLSNSNLKLGQQFILNPNQSQQLVLKIKIPNDFNSGDNYLTLFINQDSLSNLSTNSTQLIRLGSHLLISISNSELPITKFTTNNFNINTPFIDCFFSSVKFSGEIFNQSEYFNKVDDSITISKNNTVIDKLTIFPDNILAHHTRTIRCLNDISPIECQLQRPLWPGFYQAKLLDKTINFIVLPYSLIIFSIFSILIIKTIIDNSKQHQL